ncbi:hypothetical protein F4781DRAFT_318368 [Annulohypoxylon bovei var. microspora]|nr:hypothetical protein F4781DRAFT_318368 [Annulohypoxylon bovei var. microspora]
MQRRFEFSMSHTTSFRIPTTKFLKRALKRKWYTSEETRSTVLHTIIGGSETNEHDYLLDPECETYLAHLQNEIQHHARTFTLPWAIPPSAGDQENILAFMGSVARFARENSSTPFSIEACKTHILLSGILTSQNLSLDQQLVIEHAIFTSLGLVSFLYLPSVDIYEGDHVGSQHKIEVYSEMAQDMEGIFNHCQDRQPNDSFIEFLTGFGAVYPYSIQERVGHQQTETRTENSRMTSIYVEEVNAHTLIMLGFVKIKWTATLSSHLCFEPQPPTLYLFRFPFIIGRQLRALHSNKSPDNWCIIDILNQTRDTADDFVSNVELRDYYAEFLLTYRILFGQRASSRRQFLKSFNQVDEHLQFLSRPETLASLCLDKLNASTWTKERQVYSAEDDLPFFGDKFLRIQTYMSQMRPMGIRDLWMDRRSKHTWWTFWAVIVIGIPSLLVSILQCILAGLQISVAKSN